MNEIEQRNLAALTARNDRDLRDLIAGVLPDSDEYDGMWALLLTPALAERTALLLTELALDVDQQFTANRANNRGREWVTKATKFKFLVNMRLGRAKLAIKQHNLSAMKQVQAWQSTAHQLAAAIHRHQNDITGGEPEDRALWGHLDSVTRPDGTSVRNWMQAQPRGDAS